MKNLSFLIPIFLLMFISCSDSGEEDQTMLDIDGNIYNTIKLGEQTWMLENLKTTSFNDGTPITQYTLQTHGNDWLNLNTPEALYQWADTNDLSDVHDDELPQDYYGAMYNHLAIESGKLAPDGWRIPTVQDFRDLEKYLSDNGYDGVEAKTLKSATGWIASSGSGTDAVGFKGLPNGYVNALGGSTLAEGICTWATNEVNETDNRRVLVQLFDQDIMLFQSDGINIGAGIRCIKE